MKYLLDTDICSAYAKRPSLFALRFIQYGQDNIVMSALTLAELYSGAYQRPQSRKLLPQIDALRDEIAVLSFDDLCAEVYGRLMGELRPKGVVVSVVDLMIASVALTHDLTLVTHNTADFQPIPGLRLDDWLAL
jgi:tRNA(fMet)-specific endonuclease VapC